MAPQTSDHHNRTQTSFLTSRSILLKTPLPLQSDSTNSNPTIATQPRCTAVGLWFGFLRTPPLPPPPLLVLHILWELSPLSASAEKASLGNYYMRRSLVWLSPLYFASPPRNQRRKNPSSALATAYKEEPGRGREGGDCLNKARRASTPMRRNPSIPPHPIHTRPTTNKKRFRTYEVLCVLCVCGSPAPAPSSRGT